jgi:hypothetical protein
MEPSYPVNTFKAAAPLLRRPFTPAAVKFKVQATWGTPKPDSALIVAYIDARLVTERLNLICPDLWHDEYQRAEGGALLCHLTIDGIKRTDIGEGYQGKGLFSDALKRAAVKFGVGVSLYATPQIVLKTADGMVKEISGKNGPSLKLLSKGDQQCRQQYAFWLKEHGTQAFGEPLDHGDVEEAVGDVEAS